MERKLGIKLRKFNRICPISGEDSFSLKLDSHVVVLTDRGEEFGAVVMTNSKSYGKTASDVHLKKIIRKATAEDQRLADSLEQREEEASKIAMQKAKEFEIPIKVVGVESLFDTSRMAIYYRLVKENKIPDIKPLKKELSNIFKAEVTMRSVTPRDEAQLIGGLGPCGKALCCTTWLHKPKHITVKMVKDQGVQISPTKTSGVCGRLMCCFTYETSDKGYNNDCRRR